MKQKIVILVGMLVMLSFAFSARADLVMDCTICQTCPFGQVCDTQTKLCVNSCADGTPYGQCAGTKPLYCDNGQLLNDCGECGCPTSSPDCYPDGTCSAAPILTAGVENEYPYNRDIVITVSTQSVERGHTVSGRISTEDGLKIQEIAYGTWVDSNNVRFYFDPVTITGDMKFIAWMSKPVPPYDIIYSQERFFTIKAPLDVTFGITDPTQYTVKDVDFTVAVLGPNGEIIDFNRQLTAKIDGIPINVGNVQWVDEGNGKWKGTIKKEYLRPGNMEITITVTDQFGKYESVTKIITGITVNKPAVGVAILAPSETSVGDTEEIRIATSDLFGRPMDPDTIELTVTYPGSLVTKTFYKSAFQNDFQKISDGIYRIHFQFVDSEGGAYSWSGKATKELYFTGSASPVITVAGGGGIIPTCDVTNYCDPNCPDDPDCQVPVGIPWWIWPVLGVIGLVVVIWIIRR